jgi:gluconolactonase
MKFTLTTISLATLGVVSQAADFKGGIERLDPAFDALIAQNVIVEKLGEGFNWSEGPTWYDGAVVFSDVPENVIYRWKEGMANAEVFLKPSGMTTPTAGFREQGSNGLSRDAEGRLLVCMHGDRRVARWEKGVFTTLADKFNGKKFSSPNDLAVRKNGDIYFTDPPYGLDKGNESPLKEQPYNGVYRVNPKGEVSLVTKEINWPNGIGFSPDEKILYVAVSDSKAPRVMAHDVQADGSIANARVFFDALTAKKPGDNGSCDGMKVDVHGNVWATGPGGVLVISPEGKLLGRILTGQATGNCCWGDDGSSLYITADMFLVRVKTLTKGTGFSSVK